MLAMLARLRFTSLYDAVKSRGEPPAGDQSIGACLMRIKVWVRGFHDAGTESFVMRFFGN